MLSIECNIVVCTTVFYKKISRLEWGAWIYCYFLEGANDALSEYMNFIVCTSLRGANFTQMKNFSFFGLSREPFEIRWCTLGQKSFHSWQENF